jgi:hypothetical protein
MSIMKIALDLDLYTSFNEKTAPVSVSDLALMKSIDPSLLARILRFMASHGHITQTDKDHFVANDMTTDLADPRFKGFALFT